LLRIAYLSFSKAEEANKAVEEMQGSKIMGQNIRIDWAVAQNYILLETFKMIDFNKIENYLDTFFLFNCKTCFKYS